VAKKKDRYVVGLDIGTHPPPAGRASLLRAQDSLLRTRKSTKRPAEDAQFQEQ
jgi:hypothetical protein